MDFSDAINELTISINTDVERFLNAIRLELNKSKDLIKEAVDIIDSPTIPTEYKHKKSLELLRSSLDSMDDALDELD